MFGVLQRAVACEGGVCTCVTVCRNKFKMNNINLIAKRMYARLSPVMLISHLTPAHLG